MRQSSACADGSQESLPAAASRVWFTVGATAIIVRLADNPTGLDFASMLPLSLEFRDFASMEKISSLPRELTIEGSAGSPPANGDLIYRENIRRSNAVPARRHCLRLEGWLVLLSTLTTRTLANYRTHT